MNSKIEQLIDEIEDYIDSCKYKAFSTEIILVNKTEIDDLLRELRMKTPEEIQKYKKIVSNTEAIINDAKQKAQDLLDNAAVQTNELISEHQIMQQAYTQANEIVEMASQQAQEILDNATIEANNVKLAAMQYTDNILANLENIIKHSVEMSTRDFNNLVGNLQQVQNVVTSNRAELAQPQEEEHTPEQETASTPENQEATE
jgi:cell division septum initiation protein DivIVA